MRQGDPMSFSRKILRRPAVIQKTGLARATIQREEAAGRFPGRIQLARNSVGWFEDEIDQYLESRRVQPKSPSSATA
jgi:prophage regulatory protein